MNYHVCVLFKNIQAEEKYLCSKKNICIYAVWKIFVDLEIYGHLKKIMWIQNHLWSFQKYICWWKNYMLFVYTVKCLEHEMINHAVQWYRLLSPNGTYAYTWKTYFSRLKKDTRGELGTEFRQERSWKVNKMTADKMIVVYWCFAKLKIAFSGFTNALKCFKI